MIILSELIQALKKIARRVHQNDQKVGDLNALSTNSKTSLVSAINEIFSRPTSTGNEVDENQVNNIIAQKLGDLNNLTTTEKATIVAAINSLPTTSDVNQAIANKIHELTEGADEALNTFKEIGDRIALGDSATESILEEIVLLKAKDTALENFVGLSQQEELEDAIDEILDNGGGEP